MSEPVAAWTADCKHCGRQVSYHAPDAPFKGGFIPTDPEDAAWGTLCEKAPATPHEHEVAS